MQKRAIFWIINKICQFPRIFENSIKIGFTRVKRSVYNKEVQFVRERKQIRFAVKKGSFLTGCLI